MTSVSDVKTTVSVGLSDDSVETVPRPSEEAERVDLEKVLKGFQAAVPRGAATCVSGASSVAQSVSGRLNLTNPVFAGKVVELLTELGFPEVDPDVAGQLVVTVQQLLALRALRGNKALFRILVSHTDDHENFAAERDVQRAVIELAEMLFNLATCVLGHLVNEAKVVRLIGATARDTGRQRFFFLETITHEKDALEARVAVARSTDFVAKVFHFAVVNYTDIFKPMVDETAKRCVPYHMTLWSAFRKQGNIKSVRPLTETAAMTLLIAHSLARNNRTQVGGYYFIAGGYFVLDKAPGDVPHVFITRFQKCPRRQLIDVATNATEVFPVFPPQSRPIASAGASTPADRRPKTTTASKSRGK
jgi:hypothetical protein